MHRSHLAPLLLACALALPAGRAAAWGGPAHRVVADVAEARLRPAARAEALRLLAGEPAAHLADVADWADGVRDTGVSDAGGHQAASTRRWHFVDFAGGCDYVPARDCPGGDCVIAAINHQDFVLGDRRRPDAERREALKYLVHLVADVHQPLHASPVNDKGGNDYQVAWHGQGRNLHAVWDGLVLYRAMSVAGLDADGYAASLVEQPALPPDPTALSDRKAVDWALESCRVVQAGGVYPASHVIDDAWLDARRAQADLQMRRAGERLGDLLNSALDPPARGGGG